MRRGFQWFLSFMAIAGLGSFAKAQTPQVDQQRHLNSVSDLNPTTTPDVGTTTPDGPDWTPITDGSSVPPS